MLHVESEHTPRYRLFRFCGDLDIYSVWRARAATFPAVNVPDDSRPILLDLRGVEFLDTKGIAFLLSILCRERVAPGAPTRILIVSQGSQPQRVLTLAGIDRVTQIVTTVEEAVARLPATDPSRTAG